MAEDLLAGFPAVVTQAVAWGDMDAFAHVNNVVYFKYFELARIAYFERMDWFTYLRETGVGPILASTQARYRRALAYPDTIRIGARTVEMGTDRFTVEYRIASEKLGAIATDGQVVVVSFDYRAGRKVPIPDELRRRIEALEGRSS